MDEENKIPDGDCSFSGSIPVPRGLPCLYGASRCISPHSHMTIPPRIAKTYLQHGSPPVSSTSFHPFFGPKALYQDAGGNNRLRSQCTHLYPFLDDFLVRALTKTSARSATIQTLDLLQAHGFMINTKKSSLIPSTKVVHLGVEIYFHGKDLAITVQIPQDPESD